MEDLKFEGFWAKNFLTRGIYRYLQRGFLQKSDTSLDTASSIQDDEISGKYIEKVELEKNDEKTKVKPDKKFNSTLGILCCCIGSAVGCGNVWRFPRIVAQNSSSTGALSFLLAWIISLPLWSISIIITECAIGRFTKSGPLLAYRKFLSPKLSWITTWIPTINFFLSAYYSVVVGWCLYYVYYTISLSELPSNDQISLDVFNHYVKKTWYPLLTHFLVLLIIGPALIGGMKWIERINTLLISLLFVIILVNVVWAICLPRAELGIVYLFTPNFEKLLDSRLWIDAFTQNAFDTGAGIGVYSAYSAFFGRTDGVVRLGLIIPLVNNFVSLLSGITLYSTVFSTMVTNNPTLTYSAIINILKDSGEASTGLTFTWIPVFYSSMGLAGRILCTLFFICLSFAGLSSLTANLQLTNLTLKNFGYRQRYTSIITLLLTFLVGIPSAINMKVLTDQDFVCGFALFISGGIINFITLVYGVERFRKKIVNEFGIDDFKLYPIWSFIMLFVVPLEAIIFIIWWAGSIIKYNNDWYEFKSSSLLLTLTEWGVIISISVIWNIVFMIYGFNPFTQLDSQGNNPYRLDKVSFTPKCSEIEEYNIDDDGINILISRF